MTPISEQRLMTKEQKKNTNRYTNKQCEPLFDTQTW